MSSDGAVCAALVFTFKSVGSQTSNAHFLRPKNQSLLKELNHPNIVNFLGLCCEDTGEESEANGGDDGGTSSVEDEQSPGDVFLLLEYMTLGDLRDYLYVLMVLRVLLHVACCSSPPHFFVFCVGQRPAGKLNKGRKCVLRSDIFDQV